MIDEQLLKLFKDKYDQNPVNSAVAPSIAKNGFQNSALDHEVLGRHPFTFSNETKRGDITNQKSSGRCWMFAALNTARVDTMAKLNLDSFEFSQNYTLFWDKLEKSNFFLDSILETLHQATDSRLVQHLLKAPVQDGGQWDMFAGLLKKYGAVPKQFMPESFHSSNTRMLESLITKKLREFACQLRGQAQNGRSRDDLEKIKEDMLYDVYNILVKALGEPPVNFRYQYRDKDGIFHRLPQLTPQEFFDQYVGWDLDNIHSLINAPTADKPYGRAFTVKYLGSVKEAQAIRYINVPMDVLKQAAVDSILDGVPVWFGCDVGQISDRQAGIMDLDLYKYADVLGSEFKMDKAERLDYGESLLTHAMVLVGVDLDDKGQPLNWKVENSWGDKVGDKGIFSMSDAWMDEYTYQIAVSSDYIPQDYLQALDQEVIELEPWDPMGALAQWQ